MSFSGDGGVERMICNLAGGMVRAGYRVDLILARAKGRHLDSIPEGVNQIRLGTRHTLSALPALISYMRREEPAAFLAAKDRAIRVAVMARWLSGKDVWLTGRIGTTVSAALEGKGVFKRWVWYSGMRWFYRRTDHIVAVSKGVADNIRSITGLPDSSISVVANPVITEDLRTRSMETVNHPWFDEAQLPVIMGMGRLTDQKDFTTLIMAFSRVRTQLPCRLFIPGEGGKRGELEALISELGLEEDIELPGFIKNPYPFLRLSSLFVLSSRWEGSPNVLTEALSLGIPVVSTDCRSGPNEILAGGRYGNLVPVGDNEALAEAILRTLEEPLPAETTKDAVRNYTVSESVRGYLKALKLSGN